MTPFLVELQTMNILDFCALMTADIFIEFNDLTKNIKCYIKNAGERRKNKID